MEFICLFHLFNWSNKNWLKLSFIMMWRDLLTQVGVGIPHFLKVYVMPLCFYERPTSVPLFTNWKKSNNSFAFVKKKARSENKSFILHRPLFRGSTHLQQQEWSYKAPSPGITLSILASNHHSFELVYLWAAVIYFILCCASLASCVLRYQKSLWELIDVMLCIKLDIIKCIW